MKVRIVQAGGYATRDGDKWDQGDIADLPTDLAVKLTNYGIAAAAPEPVIETAELAPPENTAKRTAKAPPRKTQPRTLK